MDDFAPRNNEAQGQIELLPPERLPYNMKNKKYLKLFLPVIMVSVFFLSLPLNSSSSPTNTYFVTSTGNQTDVNQGNSICQTSVGTCTLRAAIQEANATSGENLIAFNIPGEGIHTIITTSSLPTLNDTSGGTTIDGYTQPGAYPNNEPLISNANILVQIEGPGLGDGIQIKTSGNTIRGISLYKFSRPIWIRGINAHDNEIIGNIIGTNIAATYVAPNMQDFACGVNINEGATNNKIGTALLADRNIISGNSRSGIRIEHSGSNNNKVQNNIIGLSPMGDRRVPNLAYGVDIQWGASYNLIGGTGQYERNVLSGNNFKGVELSHDNKTRYNQILGNFIGTDVTGNNATNYSYNGSTGIDLHDGVNNNLIAYNVIGNNMLGGIRVVHQPSSGWEIVKNNTIRDNFIGISPNDTPIPNSHEGILMDGESNVIGPNNTIAFNPIGIAVEMNDSLKNTITQNRIFNNTELGIDLGPLGSVNFNDEADEDTGPNDMLNFPVITGAIGNTVTGTACANCTVEIFLADADIFTYGEGERYLGSAVANNLGEFTLTTPLQLYGVITSTATDQQGNTSEFSRNFRANYTTYLPVVRKDLISFDNPNR